MTPDGEILFFIPQGSSNPTFQPASISASGAYQPGLVGQVERLVTNPATGNYELTDRSGTTYVFSSGSGTPLIEIHKLNNYVQTINRDSSGNLLGVSDNRGRSLSFSLAYGLISDVQVGGVTYLHFDYLGLANTSSLSQTSPGSIYNVSIIKKISYLATSTNESLSYTYDDTSNPFALTGITDGRGIRYATWTYDNLLRATSSQHAGGVDLNTMSYDKANSRVVINNPLNKQEYVNYSVSLSGRVLPQSVVGQPSPSCPISTASFLYDSNDFLSSQTDAEGRVTTYVNDSTSGLPSSATRGSGTSSSVTATYTWNIKWRVPASVAGPGLTTSYVWTDAGQLTSVTQTDTTTQSSPYATAGQARTWNYSYDGSGRLAGVAGPVSGVSTSYSYDANGYVKTFTNELGQVTTITATNGLGEPTSLTDPNGVITTLAYDGRGRLSSMSVDTANTPATTTIAYDAAGHITTITDPIGGTQTFAYDGAGRVTGVTNSAGEAVTYSRDAMGDVTSVTLATSAATTFAKTQSFDELGRLIKSVGAVAAKSTYKFSYDRTDNLTTVTDPRSAVFTKGFDALNRLISETDEGKAAVTLTRNGADAITAYKDPRSITTTYVRNGFGEIIQEASPDKGTTIYVRDARGLVTKRTDGRGIVTTYTYDNAGRLTATAYPANTQHNVSYTWDVTGGGNYGIGRLTGISDASGIDWRVFDTKGNVKTYYRTGYPDQNAVTSYYNYDAAGNVVGVNYPSGRFVGLQRDTLGRITNIVTYQTPTSQTAQTIASSVTWLPYGGVSSLTLGNNLLETFTTDTDYHVTAVKVQAPNGGAATVDRAMTWTGETLDAITDNQTTSNSQAFTYTPAHRLATAVGGYGSYTWTYDAVGNRTSEKLGTVLSTYAYPTTSNRLTSVTPGTGTARTFTYDASGDVATDTRTGSLGLTFAYDEEGRLVKAIQTNATANGATYTYDALGRLSARTVTQSSAPTTTTTLYVHDLDDHIIAEMNASGQTLKEYIWLNDMPVAVVDGVNTSTPTIYYVHVDHLMRPIRMTDQSWNWVWDVTYSPFGATTYLYTHPEVMNGRFPGQWFQLETGLAYNWHRHYDPTIGRYIQPDPLGLAALRSDGPSTYSYAKSSPASLVDKTGQGATGAAVGGVIGGMIGGTVGAELGPFGSLMMNRAGSYVFSKIGSSIEDLCQNGPDCNAIYKKISAIMGELKDRYTDIRINKYSLPLTGKMSVAGHQQQFRNTQSQLRRVLLEAEAMGCHAYDPAAWYWASTVNAPSPDPRP